MFSIGGVLGERVEHVAGGGVALASVAIVVILTLRTTVDSVTSRGGGKQTGGQGSLFKTQYKKMLPMFHDKRHCVLSMAAMLLLRGNPAVRLRQTPGTSSRWMRSCRYWGAVLLQRAK